MRARGGADPHGGGPPYVTHILRAGLPPLPYVARLHILSEPERWAASSDLHISQQLGARMHGKLLLFVWCPFYPRERSLCVQVRPRVSASERHILLSFSVTLR
jgi:hypothetical protein